MSVLEGSDKANELSINQIKMIYEAGEINELNQANELSTQTPRLFRSLILSN